MANVAPGSRPDPRDLLVDLADFEGHDAQVAVDLGLEEAHAGAAPRAHGVDDDDLVVVHADVQDVVEVVLVHYVAVRAEAPRRPSTGDEGDEDAMG